MAIKENAGVRSLNVTITNIRLRQTTEGKVNMFSLFNVKLLPVW